MAGGRNDHEQLCVDVTPLSEAVRSGLGFLQWGDALSGRQVLLVPVVGPSHMWEFLCMRSAGMCV